MQKPSKSAIFLENWSNFGRPGPTRPTAGYATGTSNIQNPSLGRTVYTIHISTSNIYVNGCETSNIVNVKIFMKREMRENRER